MARRPKLAGDSHRRSAKQALDEVHVITGKRTLERRLRIRLRAAKAKSHTKGGAREHR